MTVAIFAIAFALIFVIIYCFIINCCKGCAFKRRQDYENHSRPNVIDTAEIEHSYKWVTNDRGMLLFQQQFIPKTIIAVVGICHGYADHSNVNLTEFALRLCKHGIAVLLIDMEGHGLSDGLHGLIPDLDKTTEDITSAFYNQMNQLAFKNKPFFIYGHSMGGAIACNMCTSRSGYMNTKALYTEHIRGCIVVAPMFAVCSNIRPSSCMKWMLALLSYFAPHMPIYFSADLSQYFYNNSNNQTTKTYESKHKSDPLTYMGKLRVGTAMAMIVLMEYLSKQTIHFTTPILILHGTADQITCPNASTEFYNQCSSTDKTIHLYPNGNHDIVNEDDEVIMNQAHRDIVEWIYSRSM